MPPVATALRGRLVDVLDEFRFALLLVGRQGVEALLLLLLHALLLLLLLGGV